jgi:hypothetical protein
MRGALTINSDMIIAKRRKNPLLPLDQFNHSGEGGERNAEQEQ